MATPTATPAPSATETLKSLGSQAAKFAQAKLLENLPTIVETGKQQVISASTTAMDKMTPDQVNLFASNLNDINSAVQAKAQTTQPVGSSRRRKTRKGNVHKKRTHKLKRNRKH